jgi:hypothetical protein
MSINATQVANEALSYAVITDKSGLVSLLERNGIQMPNNPSDKEVTTAVLMANASSGTFRNDLVAFLSKQIPKATEDLSSMGENNAFTGIDDFSFTGGEKFFNATSNANDILRTPLYSAPSTPATTAAVTTPKTGTAVGNFLRGVGSFLKDNVLTKENISAGLQIGLQSIANKTQAQENALQQQAIQLQNTQDAMKQNVPSLQTKKSNVMTYVWVGVGVLAVGILGFVIYKRVKK